MEYNIIKQLTQKVLSSKTTDEHEQNLISVFSEILKSDKQTINSSIEAFIEEYASQANSQPYRELLKKVAQSNQITNLSFELNDSMPYQGKNDVHKQLIHIPMEIKRILSKTFYSLDKTPTYNSPEEYQNSLKEKKTEIQALKEQFSPASDNFKEYNIKLKAITEVVDSMQKTELENFKANQTPSEIFISYLSGMTFLQQENTNTLKAKSRKP